MHIEYHGNVAQTMAEAGPAWARGDEVVVGTDIGRLDYFDFVVATRRNDDEPILEMIKLFETRREMKKPYTRMLYNYSRKYAAFLNLKTTDVQRRFRQLRNEIVEPGTPWG